MLRLLRTLFRWLFAAEAAILVLASGIDLFGPAHPTGSDSGGLLRTYGFFAAIMALGFVFAAAWATTHRRRSKRSVLGVLASVINIGFAVFFFRYFRPFSFNIEAFNTSVLAAGIGGVLLFSRRQVLAPATPQSLPNVPGDRTTRITDSLFTVLFYAIMWEAWNPWLKWASTHDLSVVSFVPSILLIALASILVAALHECGHALAAAPFHRTLLAFTAGPLQWRKVNGSWKFALVPSLFRGAVSISPPPPDQPKWQEVSMLLAGPAANFITAPLFFFCALHVGGTRFQSAWWFFALMATISALCPIFNLFPFRTRQGQYSDGARLLQLLTNSPVVEFHRATSLVISTCTTPLRLRDIDPALLQHAAATRPGDVEGLRLYMCASHVFEDRGLIPEAAASLATAEAIYNQHTIDLPAIFHTNFIYFHAAHLRDAATARLWWQRMEACSKPCPQEVDYWMSKAALLWAEGHPEEAELAWQTADGFARKQPEFGAYQFDSSRVAFLHSLLHPSDDEKTFAENLSKIECQAPEANISAVTNSPIVI